MSRLKLLLITNRYPAHPDDGASPFVADFVSRLRHHDIQCTVVTPHHEAAHYDDDDVIRFRWGEDKKTIGALPLYRPSSWQKIAAYFRAGYSEADRLHRLTGFDFCLALWAAPSGLIARRLYHNCGLPYAVWCLGSDIHTYARLPLIGSLIVETLREAVKVFSDGYALGEKARMLSGRPFEYLPSMRRTGVSYSPAENKRKLFVCPGRVERSKGVFDLLDAFQSIAAQIPEWNLVYIGDGAARSRLFKRIKSLGLHDRVTCAGFLPRGEMFRLMGEASAIIIPTHRDSLPLTFGEAMQLKKPVLATDIGDLKRFIDKYDVGLVVPPQAPDQLAEGILAMAENRCRINPRFEECVREIDIDMAAEKFAGWLKEYIADNGVRRKVTAC